MQGVKVKESNIAGLGLFTDQEFNEGDLIGIAHIDGQPTEVIGKYHNHSESPNAHSILLGNKRYVAALRPLRKGEEITVDYRKQPELEQPEEFAKGGSVSMPKASKKGLASKRYTKDLTGTNRLFTKNSLFQKAKPKKKRIYDPNAKYYAEGGALLTKKVTCKKCGWKWDAADGGDDITTCHKCGGQGLIHAKNGNETGCPEGYAFNPVTGECIEWNPAVWNSEEQSTSYDPIGDVIYMNPNDRPEGMSDEEYQQMYQDQIEHEQLHRLQWINGGLKGTSGTPLRMPSTVDNQEYDGEHYYNRRGEEESYLHDMFNQDNPELAKFIPSDVIYNKVINPTMYDIPWTEEGEARGYEYDVHGGMPSLFPKRQNGGESSDGRERAKFQPGTYDPNETASYMLTEKEVTVPGQASNWGKARNQYKARHPEEKFIEKKKKQYLKRNPGLDDLYGVSMENFPEDVEQNFRNEYDYKTNTAVVKNVARKEGWNPNQRAQYVDDLNNTQRDIVAESKYGSKLQPSYWSRGLAGAQELGNFIVKQLPGEQGDVFKYQVPGLTKKEQKEIGNSNFGALEMFSPMDIPGAAIANYVKNTGLSTGSDYKEQPGLLSGQKMENVNDLEATLLNPLTYVGLEQLPEVGANLAKGLYKAGNAGVDLAKTNPQAWFKTPEQLLETPDLYRSVRGETTWKDPLGKLNKFVDDSKIKSSLKRENELNKQYPGFENRKTRIPLQQEEQNLRYAIEKAAEKRNLERTKLPIKPVLTQHGTHLGGGQGRIYVNTLNPEEVVKLGTFPGTSADLDNLVKAGKDLEGMPLMENVAFPTKGFTINKPIPKGSVQLKGNSEAVQFMPWKGNPLNAENPVNVPLGYGIPSDKAKRELQFMAQTLDDKNVGIDYFGQNNMMYDPKSDSYKLVDLNYVDDPKSAWDWNKLDKPVKQRIEDKFGYTIPEGELPLELEFANSKSIKPMLGEKIGDNTGRFNLGVYNFKDYPQYIAKVEDPAAVARTQGLDADQYMNAMVDRTKNLDAGEFSKVFRTIEGKEGKRVLVMPKLRGTLGSKLDTETLMSIPDQSYTDFYDKLKLLRDEGLNYDFYGDNFMYDPYTEKFNLFDFSPQSAVDVEPGYGNKKFFETEVFGRGNPNIYGKEQAGKNLKDALGKKLTRTYMESFPGDQEVYGLDEYNKRITDILSGLSPQKYGGIHNWF
jgi:hypothetical protein